MTSPYSPDLPDDIIHLITSSFNLKQAAQTSILSKSWNSGWLTRPILDLDEPYFPEHYRPHFDLLRFVNKTFPRYEDSTDRIQSFRLCLESEWISYGLAADWTYKAMKLRPSDVTIRLKHERNNIPISKVFGNENVISLCLQRVRIDRLDVIRIKCSGLKSLELTDIVSVSIDSFRNILSCCPLIETLSLYSLKFSDVSPTTRIRISHGKLKSLVLSELESDQLGTLFLSDLSTNFPVLKDLTVKAEWVHVISSRSLEILNLRLSRNLPRVELDLPSIRKFMFDGIVDIRTPELCFSPTTSRDRWDSHISISHKGYLSNSWFRQLSKLLSNGQRGSKIHLVLHLCGSAFMYDYQAGKIRGAKACEVDDLTIYTNKSINESKFFNYLLDGMFRICRPKMITHYVYHSYKSGYRSWDDKDLKIRNNSLLLRRALEIGLALKTNFPIKKQEGKKTEENSLTKSQLMYGLRGLNEVHAQELKEEVWMPLTMDSILDDSTSEERIVRFQLKWKP